MNRAWRVWVVLALGLLLAPAGFADGPPRAAGWRSLPRSLLLAPAGFADGPAKAKDKAKKSETAGTEATPAGTPPAAKTLLAFG